MDQVESVHLALTSAHPEVPHWLDQRYLFLAAWGFPVLAVWGFNARWLPVFLGLRKPSGGGLMAALVACGYGIAAALLGQFRLAAILLLAATSGGIWGASRHALTVGFLATMVFAIGERVLPAFTGMRLLYSTKLMFASLAILNLGCLLRVASEVPAYEADLPAAWRILPVSAVTELTAVTLFAFNLGITLVSPGPKRNVHG